MYECKIAERLVELRTLKGVTQEAVANYLSISSKTVSKWETGVSSPDLNALVGLAEFFSVTTDSLLGITKNKKHNTQTAVETEFKDLDRKGTVLKAFEIVRSVIPAAFEPVSICSDDVNDKEDILPPSDKSNRNCISMHELFAFTANSDDMNVAVMLMRNKSNFAWLKDLDKQKKIVQFLRFFSNENVLSVLYFIQSTSCPESFTADYISRNTGVLEENVRGILDDFCTIGQCNKVIAHLAEGEVTVYESFGDGIALAVVSLAYERMCGKNSYNYNFNGRCKMIRGKNE